MENNVKGQHMMLVSLENIIGIVGIAVTIISIIVTIISIRQANGKHQKSNRRTPK